MWYPSIAMCPVNGTIYADAGTNVINIFCEIQSQRSNFFSKQTSGYLPTVPSAFIESLSL